MTGAYSLAVRSAAVAVTGGGVFAELSAAAASRVRLTELGVFFAAGVAPTFGIGRPGNTPTVGTAALGQAEDTADPASAVNLYTAGWTVAPTVPATYFRRASIPATAGNGIIWSWPMGDELILGTTRNLGLLLWCISLPAATSTTVDVYARWRE